MTENKDILDAIAKMLIEQEKMNGLELLQLIQNMKPELVPEGSAAKLREFVGGQGAFSKQDSGVMNDMYDDRLKTMVSNGSKSPSSTQISLSNVNKQTSGLCCKICDRKFFTRGIYLKYQESIE